MKKAFGLMLLFALASTLFAGCAGSASDGSVSEKVEAFAPGTVSDGKYVNDSVGLSFVFPKDWLVASEEETRTILNADPNDTTTTYDILAGNVDNTARMYLINMDLSHQIGGSKMTEDALLDYTIGAFEEEIENGTETYEFSDYADSDICGSTWRGVSYVSGSGVYGATYFTRKNTDAVMLGIVALSEADRDYIIAHFTYDLSTIPEMPIAETDPEVSEPVFSRGIIENGIYTSEYLGLGFAPPSDWSFADETELDEMMSSGLEYAAGSTGISDFVVDYAKLITIYDLYASSSDGSCQIQLCLENVSSYIGGSTITEEEYADAVMTSMASIGAYESSFGEAELVTVAGIEFYRLPSYIESLDISQDYYLSRYGKYMLCISVTCAGDNSKEVLSYLYSVD